VTVKIGILGFGGRMGQLLVQEALAHPYCELAALYWREQKTGVALPSNCLVSNDLDAVIAASDVVIEFTTPEAAAVFATHSAQLGKRIVSGTTGLTPEQQTKITAAATHTAVLQAPNTSLSLAVAKQMTTLAARLLASHGYDIGINDWHHKHKKDSPSGTAKALGVAIHAGNPTATVNYSAQRLGNIVGEHQVMFVGDGEILTLNHSVTDRAIFARGAIAAALWLHGKPHGLYGMNDVLGL
jgi:4-hydroxy-tetrahydrodipicolinate reductase